MSRKKRRHKKDTKYKFYYGIVHAHTSYSTGKGTPIQAYKYAMNKKLDFLIVTDHSRTLGRKIIYKKKQKSKWDVTKKYMNKFNKKHNKFLALRGFEVSTKIFGDINIINSKSFLKNKVNNYKKLYNWVKNKNDIIISINHPHKFIEHIKYIPELDQFIDLIEVGNGSPPYKYRRTEKYYYKLLDKGWHLGAVNGQDNHRMNWGDTDNLTVVIAEKLRKNIILNAIKKRRTYSTETRTLKLIVKVNENFMGSIINNIEIGDKFYIDIFIEDKKVAINKIQIISKGGNIIIEKDINNKNRVKFKIPVINRYKPNWYIVKVIHVNGKWGISSPIFLE